MEKLHNKLCMLRISIDAESAGFYVRLCHHQFVSRGFMQIEQIDVFTLRIPQHYRVGGHTEAPGRFPGTDYYLEPQWVHAYSSVTETCLVKVTTDDGTVGWGESQS